jgi:hypothetical protein
VTVRWTSDGLEIVPAALATRQEEAHFHVFVDLQPDLTSLAPSEAEAFHTPDFEWPLTNLAPGTHTVWVTAGYRDHTFYRPYAVASVTFVVR